MSNAFTKTYQNFQAAVMGNIAHPLRGIVIENAPADWFSVPQAVTIQVTPSGASYPRQYQNVPWNGITLSTQFGSTQPQAGDYVDVVFKGGSSEFPTIVAAHPGDLKSLQAARAASGRTQVPSQALAMGILGAATATLPLAPFLAPIAAAAKSFIPQAFTPNPLSLLPE